MIPEKLLEFLKKDGVVALGTLGPDGQHMVKATKARWSWARGVVAVTMTSVTQTL